MVFAARVAADGRTRRCVYRRGSVQVAGIRARDGRDNLPRHAQTTDGLVSAMWAVTSQKNGASAIGLQRVLGLGSYDTAWTWLHKLRRAMVRPERDRLSGLVEVDETNWGSEEEGVRGRQRGRKALIVIAAQEDGNGVGRIRMRHVSDASAESRCRLSRKPLTCSVVHTDGWIGYHPLERKGYSHRVTFLKDKRNRRRSCCRESIWWRLC